MKIRNLIEERSIADRDPLWIRERRLQGQPIFQTVPFPDANEETWLRTDIRKFLPLTTARWSDGVFLNIPPEADVHHRFNGESTMNGASGNFPHSIIVVGKGSRATIIEENYSNSEILMSGMVEIFVGEGAELKYNYLQNLGINTYNLSIHRVYVEEGGKIEWIQVDAGGGLTKSFAEIILQGRGAIAQVYGAVIGNGKQHFDVSPIIYHKAEDTKGNVLIKSVLNDKARSVFQGLIKIDKRGRKTDSYLANHNLILTEGARADTIPKLEIENEDVRASHGATVGEIDPEQLFYLMSRGLSAEESQEMIVDGFIEPIVSQIDERIREKVREIISVKVSKYQRYSETL